MRGPLTAFLLLLTSLCCACQGPVEMDPRCREAFLWGDDPAVLSSQKLVPTDGVANQGFGSAAAVSGDTAMEYIFTWAGGSYLRQKEAGRGRGRT
jgi:hypothetical protein